METTESMARDDAEELGDDPKEFLFPCAQDHYTLSKDIKEDTVTGMISGKGCYIASEWWKESVDVGAYYIILAEFQFILTIFCP